MAVTFALDSSNWLLPLIQDGPPISVLSRTVVRVAFAVVVDSSNLLLPLIQAGSFGSVSRAIITTKKFMEAHTESRRAPNANTFFFVMAFEVCDDDNNDRLRHDDYRRKFTGQLCVARSSQ
jgi:hypothetical protein